MQQHADRRCAVRAEPQQQNAARTAHRTTTAPTSRTNKTRTNNSLLNDGATKNTGVFGGAPVAAVRSHDRTHYLSALSQSRV